MSDVDQEPRLKIEPLGVSLGLRQRACEAIKRAIMAMDIYGHAEEIRLDERQLSQDLGVSRTPIREALSVLEQEGFVRSVPRRTHASSGLLEVFCILYTNDVKLCPRRHLPTLPAFAKLAANLAFGHLFG